MKLENQVCSLQQAKRLKELGIRQDSLLSWCGSEEQRLMDNGKDGLTISDWIFVDLTSPVNNQHADHRDDVPSAKPFAAAFTVAELGQILPDDTRSYKYNESWQIYFASETGMSMFLLEDCNTEAEIRAAFLIWLLETNALTAKEVNKRLQE